MKFLANENYPYPSIKILRAAGFDVKSIAESNFGITDSEVIKIAQEENRIILTFDSDYGELIFRLATQDPPSVIYYRFKGAAPDAAGIILSKLIQAKHISLEGTFTVIEENNVRQRQYYK